LNYQQSTQQNTDTYKRKNRKESTKIEFEEPVPSHLLRRSIIDVTAEKARKHAFNQHHLLINALKTNERNKCTPLSQGLIGGLIETQGNMRKGQILLSQDVIQTLLHTKCETLLEAQKSIEEMEEEEEDEILIKEQKEEFALLSKLEMIKKLLRELKRRDPPRFRDLLRMFYENKKLYDLVLQEIDYHNNQWFAPLN